MKGEILQLALQAYTILNLRTKGVILVSTCLHHYKTKCLIPCLPLKMDKRKDQRTREVYLIVDRKLFGEHSQQSGFNGKI
jgi:hypothetical protein